MFSCFLCSYGRLFCVSTGIRRCIYGCASIRIPRHDHVCDGYVSCCKRVEPRMRDATRYAFLLMAFNAKVCAHLSLNVQIPKTPNCMNEFMLLRCLSSVHICVRMQACLQAAMSLVVDSQAGCFDVCIPLFKYTTTHMYLIVRYSRYDARNAVSLQMCKCMSMRMHAVDTDGNRMYYNVH